MAKTEIKHSGKFHGKSNKLGGGGRFAQMVASGKSPALAAYIGRKSLGKKKMASLAVKGKKRASRKAKKPGSMIEKRKKTLGKNYL